MKDFLREWLKYNISFMLKNKVGVLISLTILVVSFCTGEFEAFKDHYIPSFGKTFLYLIPVYVLITTMLTGDKFVKKYYVLLDELNNRKAKNKLALELEALFERNRNERGTYIASDLRRDATRLMNDSGLISQALIRKFDRMEGELLSIPHQEKILNEILTELTYSAISS